MKIITLGKKHSRYALILMKLEKPNGKSIDDTITYYNSDDLNELQNLASTLIEEIGVKVQHHLDLNIYDYHDMKYVNLY